MIRDASKTKGQHLARKIAALAKNEFRPNERDRRFITILATGFVPTMLALWGAAVPSLWEKSQPAVVSISAILMGLQMFLLYRSLDRPQSAGRTLILLSEAEEKLEGERSALRAATEVSNRLSVLQSWALALYAFQGEISPQMFEDRDHAHKNFDKILSPLCQDPAQFFGFNDSDIWNFAVYIYNEQKKELVPIWRKTDPRHESSPQLSKRTDSYMGRSWKPGIGHVGLAFIRNQALITEDSTAAEVRQMFVAPSPLHRSYDEKFYRSFASIPFGISENEGLPLGVIVGTSSRPGAFNETSSLPLRHAAAAFTALSPSIAMIRKTFT